MQTHALETLPGSTGSTDGAMTPADRSASRPSQRPGFTLVEVVVAMVLLATVLVMLAGMTFATAQRSLDVQSAGARQAAMLQVINRINATSFDVLNSALYPGSSSYCDTVDAGPDDFQVCVTVTERDTRLLRLQVVLTDDRTGTSETMTLSRTRS